MNLEFLKNNREKFKSGAVITDISGVKGIFEKALPEILRSDVDFIIGLLRMGTADSSNYTDENNDELNILSEKFLALLRDSIINHKVFRIDFDNKISVIIKIDVEGKVHAEFQTTDEATETYLKNHLHILKEKFEELNVSYGEITYKNTNK